MVVIVGHRGGRNEWPENSLLGFRELVKLGVDAVEFDVHLTRAGELVVIHDPTLQRTTEAEGIVADLRTGERNSVILKSSNGQTVPSLEEVLDVFQDTDFELQVELKADHEGNPYPGLEARAAGLLRARGLADRAILTSFLPEVLEACRRHAPGIRTLSSFDRNSAERMGGVIRGLERQLRVSDIIAVEKSVLGEHWDEIAKLVPGDRLGAWVPNTEEEIRFWYAKPIRQITTDAPSRAKSLRPGRYFV
jgi:glycerophosphoryl diester phosphodiesterase